MVGIPYYGTSGLTAFGPQSVASSMPAVDTPAFDVGKTAVSAASLAKGIGGLVLSRKRRRLEKKAREIQKEQQAAQYQNALKDFQQAEQGMMREEERALPELRASLASRGVQDSSIAQQSEADFKYAHRERIDSLLRRRAMLKGGYQASQKISDIQKRMSDLDQKEAMLNASLDAIATVATLL